MVFLFILIILHIFILKTIEILLFIYSLLIIIIININKILLQKSDNIKKILEKYKKTFQIKVKFN